MIEQQLESRTIPPVLLVGNPNVGKSALFGALSGRYVEVSNYPGTTVDYASGWIKLKGEKLEIFDSPGADTLSPVSEDEKVTRDLLLDYLDSPVICVIDAKNILRGLVLLSQLAEFDRKVIVALNMADEAASAGIMIDIKSLSKALGVPVISTIAVQGTGIEELKEAISLVSKPKLRIDFGDAFEDGIGKISAILNDSSADSRGLALSYLSGDNGLPEKITLEKKAKIGVIKEALQSRIAEPLGFAIAKIRNDQAQELLKPYVSRKASASGRVLRTIGEYSHHPLWGIPALLLVLVGLYYFVGVFGAQILVGLFEKKLFGEIVNPFFIGLFSHLSWGFARDLFVGEYGIITMAITYSLALIFPIVTTFFLAFGALEDSGYLPRLAFMVDRIFKKIGLNGRAVLPMILGLGCDTMAVLTTRILSTKKEKVMVTFLLALAVPCSAQLGVTLGILGAIAPLAIAIWLGVILGVMFLVGYISSKIIPGRSSDFILEIPPLRLPQLKNVIVKTLMRLEWYLKEAVPLFVLGTLILFTLDKLHILKLIQKAFSPIVVSVLGLPAKASESFIMGFLRRDYGAAGFKGFFDSGQLDAVGAVVAMTTITLFIPCIANFFIIIKVRGWKTALGMVLFIFPFAIAVGGVLNFTLRGLGLWQ
ncbi:MAG TPA: ferrous iron transport protein B [candidate division Zixibacteria bacterium]|nr:ferrous iron transport protein B [candidate division Zixibacteria bacterium]